MCEERQRAVPAARQTLGVWEAEQKGIRAGCCRCCGCGSISGEHCRRSLAAASQWAKRQIWCSDRLASLCRVQKRRNKPRLRIRLDRLLPPPSLLALPAKSLLAAPLCRAPACATDTRRDRQIHRFTRPPCGPPICPLNPHPPRLTSATSSDQSPFRMV